MKRALSTGGGNDANLATVKAGADKTAAMHEAVKLAMEKDAPVLVKF